MLEVDGNNNRIYTHSMKMEDEIRPLLSQFSKDTFLKEVCQVVTDNQCIEEYSINKGDEIIENNSVYDILYQNNMKELKLNGTKNLTLK